MGCVKNNHPSAQSVMDEMISSFRHIALGATADSAVHFLRAADWNFDEAVQLFIEHQELEEEEEEEEEEDTSDDYDDDDDNSKGDNLYPRPTALIHKGSFEDTKLDAKATDKWLIVNVQSNTEFSSEMLNGHTWANEALAETIRCNFVFWQVYEDKEEGQKVSCYYRVESLPAILVIDPITGLKMRSWSGMIEAETLLEDLMSYMDESPQHISPSRYKAVILQMHRKH